MKSFKVSQNKTFEKSLQKEQDDMTLKKDSGRRLTI